MMVAALVLSHHAVASAQNPPKSKETKEDKAAAELKKLAGMWEVESLALHGVQMRKDDKPVRYEFKGSIATTVGTGAVRSFTLDLSTDPKRITMIEAELKDGVALPQPNGDVVRAVYALDDTKLTLVQWKGPKPEYPKSVTPQAGDPVLEVVLRRIKD
jgi:uncharacterized protein (TIGR03067 family)